MAASSEEWTAERGRKCPCWQENSSGFCWGEELRLKPLPWNSAHEGKEGGPTILCHTGHQFHHVGIICWSPECCHADIGTQTSTSFRVSGHLFPRFLHTHLCCKLKSSPSAQHPVVVSKGGSPVLTWQCCTSSGRTWITDWGPPLAPKRSSSSKASRAAWGQRKRTDRSSRHHKSGDRRKSNGRKGN